jgi:hypothetical protein
MEMWGGKVSDIPALLERRKSQAAKSWYSTATFPDTHPYALKIRKELKQLAGIVVQRESLAQAEFCEAVKKEFTQQLAFLEGSPDVNDGDRTKKLLKLNSRFEGSGFESRFKPQVVGSIPTWRTSI